MMDLLLAQIGEIITLTDPERRALEAIATVRQLRRHELLLRAGDVCQAITFVAAGCLRLFHNVDGAEKTIQFFCENAWHTDYLSFLTGQPTLENTQALEPSTVVQLQRADLELLYVQHPVFERLGRISAERAFISLGVRHTMLSTQTPQERYQQLARDRPALLQRVPQYHIASFLGIQPETLSRIRKRLVTRI